MYKVLKRTYWAIVLPIRSTVFPRVLVPVAVVVSLKSLVLDIARDYRILQILAYFHFLSGDACTSDLAISNQTQPFLSAEVTFKTYMTVWDDPLNTVCFFKVREGYPIQLYFRLCLSFHSYSDYTDTK